MRVLLASEKKDFSRLLEGMEGGTDQVVVVGHADDVAKALLLARKLRPDVAIVDAFLPYTVGLKDVALSQVGGLDAAQMISREIPNASVMLLNNLDKIHLPEREWSSDTLVRFEEDGLEPGAKLDLKVLATNMYSSPVFARIELEKRAAVKLPPAHYSDEIILFGGVGILVGLIMMVTLILFVPGLVLACAGAVAALAGFSLKKALGFFRHGAKR